MSDPNGDKVAARPAELTGTTLGLLLVAVLLARVVVWMQSDLWYDEVVTLSEFSMGGPDGSLGHVFRHYPIANNHVLFSAIGWLWIRLVGYSLMEPVVRAPALFFSLLTVLGVWKLWERSLGRRVAIYAALLVAASPVLSPFYYQFRGYSLSFLLAVPAMAGAWEVVQGRVRQGFWMAAFPCFLLPLVIPSNALLVGALASFVLLAGQGGLPRRLGLAAAYALSGIVGASYYLAIWPQFAKVMRQTAGWSSGWLVAGNLLLGLVAHLGPVVAVLLAGIFVRSHMVGQARQERREALLLMGSCALAIAFGIVSARTAPFPRVFAVFLVPLTWGAFRLCRQAAFWQAQSMLRVAGVILICAFAWEKGASLLTQRQVAKGEHPQNLLQQYYRGDGDLSGVIGELVRREMPEHVVVLTNAHDFRTFDFYWRTRGLPTEASGPFPGADMRRVIPSNDEDRVAASASALRRGLVLMALAVNEEEAARILGQCGQTGQFEAVFSVGSRTLYALRPSGADAAAPPDPATQS